MKKKTKRVERQTLQELRQTLGRTQVEIAEELRLRQSDVSIFENREDMLISSLRRYVHALGGRLEAEVVVGAKRYPVELPG